MSLFLFKLSLIFSFFCFILSLINQTPYYNNFFFYKNSSLIEYYLRKSINLNNENNLDYLGFSPDFFNKLISFISDFWIETGILPPSYIFNANLSKCVSTIVNVGNTPNLFNVYVEGSGKQMNDLGNEQYCLDNIFINKKEDVEEDSEENSYNQLIKESQIGINESIINIKPKNYDLDNSALKTKREIVDIKRNQSYKISDERLLKRKNFETYNNINERKKISYSSRKINHYLNLSSNSDSYKLKLSSSSSSSLSNNIKTNKFNS